MLANLGLPLVDLIHKILPDIIVFESLSGAKLWHTWSTARVPFWLNIIFRLGSTHRLWRNPFCGSAWWFHNWLRFQRRLWLHKLICLKPSLRTIKWRIKHLNLVKFHGGHLLRFFCLSNRIQQRWRYLKWLDGLSLSRIRVLVQFLRRRWVNGWRHVAVFGWCALTGIAKLVIVGVRGASSHFHAFPDWCEFLHESFRYDNYI